MYNADTKTKGGKKEMGMRLNVTDALRTMITLKGKSMAQVCRELSMGTPANLTNMILRGGVKMSTGARIADACDYELMLVPKGTDVENGIAIAGGDKE